jgi:hypothetical protein
MLVVYQAVSRLDMDLVLLQEIKAMLYCGQELREAMLT